MHAAVCPPLTIVLLGPPGSGKGTQAAQLSNTLGIPAISTGDMLRGECASGSALGRSVKAILDSGRLVDDQTMNEVVAARLNGTDCAHGFILDGYPRTVQQAGFLNELLRSKDLPAPLVIHLDVELEEIRTRLARRLQCPKCGMIGSLEAAPGSSLPKCRKDGTTMVRRSDDGEYSAILERVRSYQSMTASLVGLYRRQNYYRVSGTRPISDVSNELLEIVSPYRPVANIGHLAWPTLSNSL